MTDLTGVVRLLKKEQERLTKQLKGIGMALAVFGKTYGKQIAPRKLSAAGRARISAAQRARWSKVKATSRGNVAMPKKRTLSAAARKKIAAAQRARWAKVKAAKKSA